MRSSDPWAAVCAQPKRTGEETVSEPGLSLKAVSALVGEMICGASRSSLRPNDCALAYDSVGKPIVVDAHRPVPICSRSPILARLRWTPCTLAVDAERRQERVTGHRFAPARSSLIESPASLRVPWLLQTEIRHLGNRPPTALPMPQSSAPKPSALLPWQRFRCLCGGLSKRCRAPLRRPAPGERLNALAYLAACLACRC